MFGGMLQLRGDPFARILALRAQYGGFVRLGPLGPRDVFLATSPPAIRHVLLDNHANYKKGLAAQRMLPVFGRGSLLLDGELWRRRRRLVQPAFHKQKIATYASNFVAHADAMLERWRKLDGAAIVDARQEMLQLTMGLTLANMFRAEAIELQPLLAAWPYLYGELTRGRLRLLRLPSWVPNRERRETDTARATIRRELVALIRRRGTTDDGSVLAMLRNATDPDGKPALSEAELLDEVMTIFAGGYETSSNALGFAVAMLALHPDIAARQRAEVDQALGARAPEAADLPALPYTRAVIEETMRIYPPSWMITREALADDAVLGHPVRTGSQILISSYGVHHAPDVWPEPEQFRPERFMPDAPERDRFSYIPFGGGPRVCVGDQYAVSAMTCVLTRIAQRCTLRLVAGTKVEAQAHIGLRSRYPLRIELAWR